MKKLLAAIAAAAFTVVAVPVAGAATPQASDQESRIRIDIDPLQPQLVTADQADNLTVSGKLTNVGDRKVSKLQVALERGNKLGDAGAVRAALQQTPSTNTLRTGFHQQVESIAPGQTVKFNLNVTLHSKSDSDSLNINDPGVYALSVNANGIPDYGQLAKVGQSTTLLPVLSAPGGGQTPKPPTPAKLSVLWPLSDRPRILTEERTSVLPSNVVLTDDDLATSLTSGGRLDGLLGAAEAAPATLAPSLCFAIDPDLLTTVWAMTGSYQVLGTDGTRQAGRSQAVAKAWLDRLKTVVQGRCVFALPFADADLTALDGVNASTLVAAAVSDGNNAVLQKVLGVSGVPHLTWPINGQLDTKTADLLTGDKIADVLVSSATAPGNDPVRIGSATGPRAIRTDDLVSTALASSAGAIQATLAALVTRATDSSPLVVAPPHQWTASAVDATALLTGLQTMVTGQYLTPAPLTDLMSGSAPAKSIAPDFAPQPSPVATEIETAALTTNDLLDTMQQDPSVPTTPEQFMAPVVNDLVRSGSGAWRGDDGSARKALSYANELIQGVRDGISVVQPRSPITMASQDSPLLVTVINNLPVQVLVGVALSNTTGLNPELPPLQLVASRAQRGLQITSKVVRTGKFTVGVGLTTKSGHTRLGAPAQLEMYSTVYGPITLIITGIAGVALFGLSGLRIYRRVTAARKKRKAELSGELPVPSEAAPAPVHHMQPARVPAGSDERPDES